MHKFPLRDIRPIGNWVEMVNFKKSLHKNKTFGKQTKSRHRSFHISQLSFSIFYSYISRVSILRNKISLQVSY